jgi:hypothetical protein
MPPLPNREAPPYEGPGPHLVIIGEDWSPEWDLQTAGITQYSLPEEWRAYDEEGHEWDVSSGGLYVCLTDLRQRGDTPIGTCEWEGAGASDVYPATYTFEVSEARSGRELAAFDLDSDLDADLSCPPSVLVHPGGSGPDLAQGVSDEALAAELGPFVRAEAVGRGT